MLVPLGAAPGLSPEGPRTALELAQQLTGNTAEETVVCGPGSMDQGHTANEFIDLSQIGACEDFMRALAAHLTLSCRIGLP